MQTLDELGLAVAERRRILLLSQAEVASRSGITADTLSRFELGKGAEFGARELLAVLSVLGMGFELREDGTSGFGSLRGPRLNALMEDIPEFTPEQLAWIKAWSVPYEQVYKPSSSLTEGL